MVQSKILSTFRNLKHLFAETDKKKATLFWQNSHQQLFEAQQTHGNNIFWLSDAKRKYVYNADGLGTAEPGFALKIRSADCLPIFIYDHKKCQIMAVHAGWKGLSSGVIKKSISVLNGHGSRTEDLFIAIGPHIRKCCYSVPTERIEYFSGQLPVNLDFSEKRGGKYFLDLCAIAVFQLTEEDIRKENIDIVPDCTCCSDQFFSFYRDGENAGRMSNIIFLTGN